MILRDEVKFADLSFISATFLVSLELQDIKLKVIEVRAETSHLKT